MLEKKKKDKVNFFKALIRKRNRFKVNKADNSMEIELLFNPERRKVKLNST